jgi:hypothetical protein
MFGGAQRGPARQLMIRVMSARDRLSSLGRCSDAASLATALRALCAEFGQLTRIKVLTLSEAEKRRALCLLRLESPEQEQRLMSSLEVSRFGEDVMVLVDLQPAKSLTMR